MKQSTTTIVSNVSYNAANQLLSIDYPTGTETRAYNTLGQLTNVTVQLPYYPYTYPENLTYTYPTGTNNGKASSMYNAVSGETVTYTYDSLNRLLTANGSGWGQQYGFDGFGNLLSKTVTAGSGPSLSVSVNAANNQIQGVSGLTYDANGNQSQNVGAYDAENRLVGGPGMYYGYDAQNKRIWSWTGAVDSYGNTTNYTVNVYSPSGQKLGAYAIATVFVNNSQTMFVTVPSLNVTLSAGDQYFGGRRLAAMDQLGSVGNYFPWGEDKGGTSPQDTWNFGTYWRDSATGLDYANNRYYSNAYGRFMTPDPSTSSQDPKAPQTWNRYPYLVGDPVNGNDPDGTDPIDPSSRCPTYTDGYIGCVTAGDYDYSSYTDDGTSPVDYTSGDVTGYDTDGNPIIGDATTSTSVTVTSTSTSVPTTAVTGSGGGFGAWGIFGGQGTLYYIPGTNTWCTGLSGGIGTPGVSGNGGNMTSFSGANIQNIIQGLSLSFSAQLTPWWGGQVSYSPGNGWASGPTVGTLGLSFTIGGTSCGGSTSTSTTAPNRSTSHHMVTFGHQRYN